MKRLSLAASAAVLAMGMFTAEPVSASATCECTAVSKPGNTYDFAPKVCGGGKVLNCGKVKVELQDPTACKGSNPGLYTQFGISSGPELDNSIVTCTVTAQDPNLDKMDCVTAAKTKFGDRYVEASCSPQCPKPLEEVTNTNECKASPTSKICCAEVKPLPAGSSGTSTTTPPPNLGSPTTLPDPLGGANIFQVINRVVSTFLGVVGSIALLAFVYAGLLYMVSTDAKTLSEAKSIMTNAVIGLVILMFAYTISVSFLNFLIK